MMLKENYAFRCLHQGQITRHDFWSGAITCVILIFFFLMKKKDLENLMLTGYIKIKRKNVSNLPNELVEIDDRTGTERDFKGINIA